MQSAQIETLVLLRTVVGYLGEREQYGWWQSAFFGAGSSTFLAPLFGKTQLLTQCNGVTRAAALVHDERIGVGNVYHLFRLPEDMEHSLHRALQETALADKIGPLVTNKATALAQLRTMLKPAGTESIRPTRIGDLQKLRTIDLWAVAAAHYVQAFERGVQICPYFSTPVS